MLKHPLFNLVKQKRPETAQVLVGKEKIDKPKVHSTSIDKEPKQNNVGLKNKLKNQISIDDSNQNENPSSKMKSLNSLNTFNKLISSLNNLDERTPVNKVKKQ